MNWKWPKKPTNNYAPWYTIARRILVMPLFLSGFVLMYVSWLLGDGIKGAEKFRKDTF